MTPFSSHDLRFQPRTNEQIFANLSKGNNTIVSMQQQRKRNLSLLANLSRTNGLQVAIAHGTETDSTSPPISFQTFQAVIASQDLSLECFLLRFVLEKLPKYVHAIAELAAEL